ncbi:MAG: flagellar basal-body MS-ring/collar protein FliF [Chloroherpetonaceae bacterium]|nr:flagellar basal-body MS-ring/collar protein FliF [Chthonomonadaceae bacterium]MDW8208744.1 flagellar basal-body MS-ring/collar protein FliF [Chloroherpetonaceae bacterium]
MFNRVRTWWEGLSRNNQIILVVSTLGVLVAMVGFISWASTPEYALLASGLSPQDASTITDKLREQNVPFRLAQGGTSIEVPLQKRDELRMRLASEGLPRQGSIIPGYELLDKAGSFMTPPQEAQMLLRAREGEVSKSIMTLEQVASATVRYAAEQNSPFLSEQKPPSASVIVTLKPGMTLSKENVRAIVRLTQMPYTGLDEKNISVVDSEGNVLWDGPRTDEGQGDENLEKQKAFAREKRAELQAFLDSMLGRGKSVVLVNAELNFDKQTEESVVPEAGVAANKTVSTETMTGAGSITAPPAGATANVNAAPNIPTYQVNNQDANGEYRREETTTSYQVGQTRRVTTRAPMRVEKLTVSAMIDSSLKGPDGQPVDLAAIKKMLETYVGVTANDPTRVVTVEQFPFDRSAEIEAEKVAAQARRSEVLSRIFSIAIPLALMLICFLLLARALKRAVPAPAGQLALAGGGALPPGSYALEGALPAQATAEGEPGTAEGPEAIGLPTGAGTPRTFDVIEEAFDAHLESILHLARSKPEMVAALLKTWVSEEA